MGCDFIRSMKKKIFSKFFSFVPYFALIHRENWDKKTMVNP